MVDPVRTIRKPLWWHLVLLLAVSIGFESLFLHHGLNRYDEGWPLYAAMRLHRGGVLYQDAFFAFPPGHVLPAWIAYGLDPPGVVLARTLYAGFNVALSIGVYLLGRRLMPVSFALLGALLLGVGAPCSHLYQLLFGYRYLVFSVLALLAFSVQLRSKVTAGCCRRGSVPAWPCSSASRRPSPCAARWVRPRYSPIGDGAAGCAIGAGSLSDCC